jgi:hypothetical protein
MCSLWPTFSCSYYMRVELWAKPYGIKVRCYGNILGNPLRTSWEHIGNMMGTRKKSQKNPRPPSNKFYKKKTWTPHESMLSLSLAAWNFYFQNCLSTFLAWGTSYLGGLEAFKTCSWRALDQKQAPTWMTCGGSAMAFITPLPLPSW